MLIQQFLRADHGLVNDILRPFRFRFGPYIDVYRLIIVPTIRSVKRWQNQDLQNVLGNLPNRRQAFVESVGANRKSLLRKYF